MADTMAMIPNFNNDDDDDNKGGNLGGLMRGMANLLNRLSDKLDDNKKEISSAKTEISNTKDKVNGIAGEIEGIKTEVTDLKDNQFVEPWQDSNIQRAARIRVNKLLGIVWKNGRVVSESIHDYKAYYSKFLRALHGDAKKVGLEGRKIHQTPRKNYQKLIEFISEWTPVRGVEGQKEYYDELAQAKD